VVDVRQPSSGESHMPVLTTPFTTLPRYTILNGEKGENHAKLFQYPGKTFSTELTIKPSAGETWAVEGLSLSFSTKLEFEYTIGNQPLYTALVKQKEALEKQKTAIEDQKFSLANVKTYVEAKVVAFEQAQVFAQNIYDKELTEVHAKELYEASAAANGARQEREVVNENLSGAARELAGVERELAKIEGELNELGFTQIGDGSTKSPFIILAKMYARGNELVWNNEIEPVTLRSFRGFEREEVNKYLSSGYVTFVESVQEHVQFNDPIDITERENLKLEFQFLVPPEELSLEGWLFTYKEKQESSISLIQSNITYSSTT
jgi:hypothetical protein